MTTKGPNTMTKEEWRRMTLSQNPKYVLRRAVKAHEKLKATERKKDAE